MKPESDKTFREINSPRPLNLDYIYKPVYTGLVSAGVFIKTSSDKLSPATNTDEDLQKSRTALKPGFVASTPGVNTLPFTQDQPINLDLTRL